MSKNREDPTPSGEVVRLERLQVICPACGQQVEAVARDGRVLGYCAVVRYPVDFQVTQLKDGVVHDYLAGAKTIDIQLEYKISPGVMYRILHASHVKLRTDGRKPKGAARPDLLF
ncbi:hypothetical protein ES703_32306 [subsurface metagenome]